jgi:hypothetical protein
MGGTAPRAVVGLVPSTSSTSPTLHREMPHHPGTPTKSYSAMVGVGVKKKPDAAVPFALQTPSGMRIVGHHVKTFLATLKERVPTSFPRPNWLPTPHTPITPLEPRLIPSCSITFDKPPKNLTQARTKEIFIEILGKELCSTLIYNCGIKGKQIEIYWKAKGASMANKSSPPPLPSLPTPSFSPPSTPPLTLKTTTTSSLSLLHTATTLNPENMEAATSPLSADKATTLSTLPNQLTSLLSQTINPSPPNNESSQCENYVLKTQTQEEYITQQQDAMQALHNKAEMFIENEPVDGASKVKVNRLDAVHHHLIMIKGFPIQWSMNIIKKVLFSTLNIPRTSLAIDPYSEQWGPRNGGCVIYLPYSAPQAYFIALAVAKKFSFQIGEFKLEWDYAKPPRGYRRWCSVCLNPHNTKDCPIRKRIGDNPNNAEHMRSSTPLDIEKPILPINEQSINSMVIKNRIRFDWKRKIQVNMQRVTQLNPLISSSITIRQEQKQSGNTILLNGKYNLDKAPSCLPMAEDKTKHQSQTNTKATTDAYNGEKRKTKEFDIEIIRVTQPVIIDVDGFCQEGENNGQGKNTNNEAKGNHTPIKLLTKDSFVIKSQTEQQQLTTTQAQSKSDKQEEITTISKEVYKPNEATEGIGGKSVEPGKGKNQLSPEIIKIMEQIANEEEKEIREARNNKGNDNFVLPIAKSGKKMGKSTNNPKETKVVKDRAFSNPRDTREENRLKKSPPQTNKLIIMTPKRNIFRKEEEDRNMARRREKQNTRTIHRYMTNPLISTKKESSAEKTISQ